MRYLLFLLILSGCATAEKSFNKALDKDRNYVAGRTRELWPCVTTEKKVTVDSSAYNQYRDELTAIKDFYEELLNNIEPEKIIDTITLVDSVRCNELKSAYKRNEGKYLDKIRLLNSKISELSDKISKAPPVLINEKESVKDMAEVEQANIRADKAEASAAEWENTAKRRGKWNLWLLIACALLGAGHILRSRFMV